MREKSLEEVYTSLDKEARRIFVVPLIRYSNKDSDYLYLLYQDLIESEEFSIESVSVYNHFKLLSSTIKKEKAILHYHWLEFQDLKSMLAMPWKLFCIWVFKTFGGPLVWTIHNEFPHDRKYLKLNAWMRKNMARWADVLHVHCEKAVQIMKPRLNVSEGKFFVCPHPDFPMKQMPRNEAIDHLNREFDCGLQSDHKVLLMFGNISQYKQQKEVAKIVTDLEDSCRLIIAGPVKKGHHDLYKELNQLREQTNRLILIPSFIDEEQVPWFFNAADICVFNYREILSSGGIHLAKSYKKRIIAPDMGCNSTLRNHPGIKLFGLKDDLKDLIKQELAGIKHD